MGRSIFFLSVATVCFFLFVFFSFSFKDDEDDAHADFEDPNSIDTLDLSTTCSITGSPPGLDEE